MKHRIAKTLALAFLAFFATHAARAEPEWVKPEDHDFLKVERLSIEAEDDGRPALKGFVVRHRRQRVPPGTHLQIVAMDAEEKVIKEDFYLLRRTDFNDSEYQAPFTKFIDLTDPRIAKVLVQPRTGPPSAYVE